MKFLLVNFSPNKSGTTKRALNEALMVFTHHGEECSLFDVGAAPRAACTGCGECRKVGNCVFGDLDELVEAIRISDGIIFGTPTHYVGAIGTLISTLSRICYSSSKIFAHKPIAILATARRAGAVSAVTEAERFFAFTESLTVRGVYPPHLYGGERDSEGLLYARSIAENMLWVAKSLEYAKRNGIEPPEREPTIRTNV